MTTLTTFTSKALPNFSIEITANGVFVWASVNINPSLKPFLSPNNVYKSEKLWVYALKCKVDKVDTRTVNDTYDKLLNRCMIICREAKIKMLQKQIHHLKQ